MTTFHPLAVLAQVADTVVMVEARGALETASAIADVVLAGFMILFVAGLSLLLLQLRRINRTVRRLGDRLLGQVDPLVESGSVVADNMEYISTVVRHDVEKLNTSVQALKERLDLASQRMEERIEEFNALMEVVQGEAEDIFLGTAAAVEGVKAGARTLRDGSPKRPGALPPVADGDEADEAAADGGVYVTGPARVAGEAGGSR